ncbi:MAG TPA: hypothetical protein VEY67_09730 [Candidatus Dormibacteraeota bacterium]|nr:hypothetical protein [Candidatus Dormibacteraeota bacterium]
MTRHPRRVASLGRALALAALLYFVATAPAVGPRPAAASDASPTPAPAGDPRSSGEGAGLVGAPLMAVGGVLIVGLLAVGGTLVYVRLTGGTRRD